MATAEGEKSQVEWYESENAIKEERVARKEARERRR
jgi:hypothetical protein